MRIRPKALTRRPIIIAAVTAALALPALAFVGPAQALDATKVGPRDARQFGFPTYYTDNVGTALQLCDDGSGNCLGANNASLTPGDGENFYWMATSTLTAPGIDVSVEYALEAAWLTPTTPITFDRLRVRGDVAAAGDYTVTTPFGNTFTVTAEDPANQRNLNGTEDLGCAGAPCDFAAAAGANHITDFLANTTRPAGYLGNAATEGPATVGLGGPAATNSITGPAGTATSTNFAVMGKLASPRAVSVPTSLDFGNTRKARTRTVRMVNLGTQPLTLGAATLRGSKAITQLPGTTCTSGRVVNPGGGCKVTLRYRPGRAKAAAAILRIRDTGRVHAVRIKAGSAAVARVRNTIQFRPVQAGARGHKRRVTVTNTGALPLKVRGVHVAGRNGRSFKISSGAPRVCRRGTVVPTGGHCAVYLRFEPKSFGPKQAGMTIRTNAKPASQTVRLRGAGR